MVGVLIVMSVFGGVSILAPCGSCQNKLCKHCVCPQFVFGVVGY